jgi:uncharacterized membrane protein YidH (DUF202 family)
MMQVGMFLLGYGIKNYYQNKKNIAPSTQIIIGLLLLCLGIIIIFIIVISANPHI